MKKIPNGRGGTTLSCNVVSFPDPLTRRFWVYFDFFWKQEEIKPKEFGLSFGHGISPWSFLRQDHFLWGSLILLVILPENPEQWCGEVISSALWEKCMRPAGGMGHGLPGSSSFPSSQHLNYAAKWATLTSSTTPERAVEWSQQCFPDIREGGCASTEKDFGLCSQSAQENWGHSKKVHFFSKQKKTNNFES